MVISSTLCPAVHISGSLNVYSRAKGIADHYWPRAVFLRNYAVIGKNSYSYSSSGQSSPFLFVFLPGVAKECDAADGE